MLEKKMIKVRLRQGSLTDGDIGAGAQQLSPKQNYLNVWIREKKERKKSVSEKRTFEHRQNKPTVWQWLDIISNEGEYNQSPLITNDSATLIILN